MYAFRAIYDRGPKPSDDNLAPLEGEGGTRRGHRGNPAGSKYYPPGGGVAKSSEAILVPLLCEVSSHRAPRAVRSWVGAA
jgi:hypothetical protein